MKQKPTPEYRSWQHMRDRCNNERSDKFKYYGLRGIKICKRWESFSLFLSDMGPRPAGSTLDRIDNNLGYSPGNCRWSSRSEQSRHRRCVKTYRWRGKMLTLAQVVETERVVQYGTAVYRLRAGWPLRSAVTTPTIHPKLRSLGIPKVCSK